MCFLNKVIFAMMDFTSSVAVRSTNRATSVRRIRNLLLCFLVVLQALLYGSYAHAIDPPANIRLEQNLLLWDDVADASKYDIYLLSSAGSNANGTYLTTVVGANEYALSTAGIYTVVSTSPNGEYSALDSGGRVEYDTSINIGAIDPPANIRLEQNRMLWDDVADVSKYDIYLLSSVGPNANGTYLTTVVGANEYTLSTAGVYTVVSAAPNGEYSTLDSGGRVEYDNTISIGTIDPPANIRLEQNLLLWDDVAGVSKYDIYLLNSAGPNANGTYITTVVGANEFALSTAGIYTVVSVSPNGEYSALDSGGRVEFDIPSSD